MNGRNAKTQKAAGKGELSRERAVYGELVRGFGNSNYPEIDESAFGVLDRILDFGKDDRFYCEATCLSYAAHVLTLENGPRELWVILDNDGLYAFPSDEDERYVEEMVERGKGVAQIIGDDYPSFKGFANIPPDGPYKLLITVECAPGPDALCWAEMSSIFYHELDETSMGALVYPPIDKQPETQSLREGILVSEWISWAVEVSNGQVIIGVGGGNGSCRMADLSDPGHPWELEASPFVVAACGGCLVPSMCRKCSGSIEETTIGELATRISRGTSLSRKTLNPIPAHEAHKGETLLAVGDDGSLQVPDFWLRDSGYGFRVREGDTLFLDSSCINSDQVEPLFIDGIPKGQERYTVYPHDGEVLLISRNEKSFVFYKALAPTLIANSVYVVWLSEEVDNRYLECWLEGSFAERWLKTAGEMSVDLRSPEPILSKGTLSSLPVPILDKAVADRTVSRKNAILDRIQELYYQIAVLESREAFAPASAIANDAENTPLTN